ncbi:MAG: hypothetical protein HDT22_08070 [Ruminococcus sp.]|nr:hypothetical protein [Ruminococcus sp.]
MKKRILISTLIALMLDIVQPVSAVSFGVHGYAGTIAQETDDTTDNGAIPLSVIPDTIKITETGEILWLSNHAKKDEITTLRLSLQITDKADAVTVEFHTDAKDKESGYYKVEEYRYNPTTGLLDIYLSDIKALFVFPKSDNSDGIDLLNIGTITVTDADGKVMPINSDIVQIISDSIQYIYQNELTVVTVETEIETIPEIVIQEETEESIETTEETIVETTTSALVTTVTTTPAPATTVAITSTIAETTSASAMKIATISTIAETTSAPAATVATTSTITKTTSALATIVAITSTIAEIPSAPATKIATTSTIAETTSASATIVATTSTIAEIPSAPATKIATTSTIAETTSASATIVATTSTIAETTSVPATIETSATHIASNEDLCDWVIVDYEDKTGITADNAEITDEENGNYEITLKDKDEEILDIYIIDPNTSTGTETNNNKEVNLPQTGNYSLTNLMIAVGAFLVTGIGFYTIKISDVIGCKEK